MLLWCLDAVFLILITISLGVLVQNMLERLFHTRIQSDLPGTFLAGLILSTIYFNILSFWLPVNYLSLIPLALISLLVFRVNKEKYRQISLSIKAHLSTIRQPSNWLFGGGLLIMLFCFCVVPCINTDSKGYHYQSILWYEKFKVIPGLANVHGRYAFNPAAFIIQSAYSFTGLTGQAIYPLNGVLIGLFLFWILIRMLRHKNSLAGLVWFLLLTILCRPLLSFISSPSSDPLVLICLFYALIRLFEALLRREITLSAILLPSLILLFAPIAKLSAIPLLLVLLYFFFLLPATEKKIPLLLKMVPVALLLYLPWLGRNIILSGYLVYPIPDLDFFHPDWKVPRDVLMVDYFLIHYWPKGVDFSRTLDYAHLPSPSFREWFLPWLVYSFKGRQTVHIIILLLAIFSPLSWAVLYFRKIRPGAPLFVFLLILYGTIWIWLNSSPDFRFGIVPISLSFIFPLLLLTLHKGENRRRMRWNPLPTLFIALTIFFLYRAYNEPSNYPFTWRDCWLFPLKDPQYRSQNNKADFPYVTLNSGTKLYLSDATHHCLNADLPCMSWKYGEIEMRGPGLENGFRNIKDDIRGIFPF